jgi:hypothetical protein
MQEIEVDNFTELHEAFEVYRPSKLKVFRGHARPEWDLIPRAGREPYASVDDKEVFEAWKRRAFEYIDRPPDSDWGWLAIAQHHGLATRLLDWTKNPLIGAYFAVEEDHDCDAIVYAAHFVTQASPDGSGPMDYPHTALYYPKGVVPRITRQGGLFSIHDNPTCALSEDSRSIKEIDKIVIDSSFREELRSQLSFYGINRLSLFPDLDGLADFTNWTIESREYWQYATEE